MNKRCGEECEVYSRVVGYFRPVKQWNKGKQEEFKDRREFKMGMQPFTEDDKYIKMAYKIAELSTCLRRKVGAVFIHNKGKTKIIVSGYNGPPLECNQCKDIGCVRIIKKIKSGTQQEICRAIHAEQMILLKFLKLLIVPTENDTLYCTHHPCVICAKLLIGAGIKHIVYSNEYPDLLSITMLREAGVEVKRI